MLDMGFEPQIRKIVKQSGLPRSDQRQTLMFSATFAESIQRVAGEYLRGAAHTAHVTVGRVGSSMSTIQQSIVLADGGTRRDKLEVMRPLVVPGERTIIFAAKKHVAKWLCAELQKLDGTRAVEIHGDRSQGQRESALKQFREGDADVLVATDVASRGIDVPNVAHVIQFDLPHTETEFDAYVHRIGRTGRAGKSGRATSLFVPGDEPKVGNGAVWQPLAQILNENGQEFPRWFEECQPRGALDPRAPGVWAAGKRHGTPDRAGRDALGTSLSGQRKGGSAPRSRSDGQDTKTAPKSPLKIDSVISKGNRHDRRAAAAVAVGRGPNAGLPKGMETSSTATSSTASPPTQQQLLRMTVVDLKESCRQLSLPVSGKKEDLIARLVRVSDNRGESRDAPVAAR